MVRRGSAASARLLAPAKVNLALHVIGRRADGFHEIDTLVAFADIGDVVVVSGADGLRFHTTGSHARGLPEAEQNLCMRAARNLREALKKSGARLGGASIELAKHLPVASGIGGGSADAAATLLALRDVWDCGEFDLTALAPALGADVAMCLLSAPLRARGIGDRIEPLAGRPALPAVLVNPGVGVATKDVFAALAPASRSGIGELAADPFAVSSLETLRNDLEAPAIRLFPQIGKALRLLADAPECRLARMSGSGATCFALCDSAADARRLRARIVDRHPDWWCVATKLGAPGRAAPHQESASE